MINIIVAHTFYCCCVDAKTNQMVTVLSILQLYNIVVSLSVTERAFQVAARKVYVPTSRSSPAHEWFTCLHHVPCTLMVYVPTSHALHTNGLRAFITCHAHEWFTCLHHVPCTRKVYVPSSRSLHTNSPIYATDQRFQKISMRNIEVLCTICVLTSRACARHVACSGSVGSHTQLIHKT